MTVLRNVRIWIAVLALTAYYATRIVWNAYRGCRRGLESVCTRAPRGWGGGIVRAAGVEVELDGAEHIDPDRPQIVVANHASWFDVFALAARFPGAFHFVAKKELAQIPVFGKAWRACGHIEIDRSDHAAAVASLEQAAEKIRSEDATIIMFPEGTRSPTGEVMRFKKGAFVLALKAGVPVVPVALVGSRDVMPKGSWLVRPGRIRIRIGPPIPAGDRDVADRNRLLRESRAAVIALLRGGTPETPDPERAGLGATGAETTEPGGEPTTSPNGTPAGRDEPAERADPAEDEEPRRVESDGRP